MNVLENNDNKKESILPPRKISNPQLIEQRLFEFRDNPFIEALPPKPSMSEIIDKCTIYPQVDAEDINQPSEIREEMVSRLQTFVQPVPQYFKIAKKLDSMLRRGYVARNPFGKNFFQRLDAINKLKEKGEKLDIESLEEHPITSTAKCFSIIGISGIGKTTAIKRLLLMYPQQILFTSYKGQSFTRTQIVWLKIDCPYDGSLKTMCKIFFQAVDNLLGTEYLKKFGRDRNSTSTMMLDMTYLATKYGIGILVIDEIQHLMNSKKNNSSKAHDEILRFLVTLVNTFGIPTILVGTPEALSVLTEKFSSARRASSEGAILWDRIKKGEDWNFFLETMWNFQWLRGFTPLTTQLNEVMYQESQGITSVAVDLFRLAQEEALLYGKEKLTVKLIRNVAKSELTLMQGMLNALRNNSTDIKKYSDISICKNSYYYHHARNVDEEIEETKNNKQKKELLRRENEKKLLRELKGLFENLKDHQLSKIIKSKVKDLKADSEDEYLQLKQEIFQLLLEENTRIKEQKEQQKNKKLGQKNSSNSMGDLRRLFKYSQDKKVDFYNLLEEANYTRSTIEFIRG